MRKQIATKMLSAQFLTILRLPTAPVAMDLLEMGRTALVGLLLNCAAFVCNDIRVNISP